MQLVGFLLSIHQTGFFPTFPTRLEGFLPSYLNTKVINQYLQALRLPGLKPKTKAVIILRSQDLQSCDFQLYLYQLHLY